MASTALTLLTAVTGPVMGKDETDNPLIRSIFKDFGLKGRDVAKVEPGTTAQLGGTLLNRAETIYAQTKYVRTLAGNVADNPTRFGCTIVALAAGLARIYSGDLISGGLVAALGAKELYNQCSDGGNSTLERMLNDIGADVDMVRSLEEGQRKSYQVIEENLTLISGDVQTLYTKLDQIQALNTDQLQFLEGAKKQAYEKGLEAKEAYRQALTLFSEAKEGFGASKEVYAKCAEYFQQIKELATDDSDEVPVLEKIDSLVEVAETASNECAEGKGILDRAEEKFSQAMQALGRASSLKDEVIEMVSGTVQAAQAALKAGAEKAVYTREGEERIESTQREVQEVKERSDDVMKLLDEMSADVKRAKIEAGKKLDPSDVVVGVGTGILLSSFGPLSALAVGVTAAYAWHNGSAIADTTKKVYNYFFGAALPPAEPMKKNEYIRVHLNETSSGYYGWMKGRHSYTHGSVDVNFGNQEIVQLRFDLNQPGYPVSKEDLFVLYNRMFAKLGDGTLSPKRCKEILRQLQTVEIERGGLNHNARGLIKEWGAAFGLVKALNKFCEKLQQPTAQGA